MSRLPRHLSRVKPPLRGRAATQPVRGAFAPVATVRRPPSPYGSSPLTPGRGALISMPEQQTPGPVKQRIVKGGAPTNSAPRQPPRVQPPLRGRAATRHFQGDFAPIAAVRRPLKPYSAGAIVPGKEAPPKRQQPTLPHPPPSALPQPRRYLSEDGVPTNRSLRQPSRVQPPLRGRAATRHFRGEFATVAAVRRPLIPPSSGLLAPGKKRPKPVPPYQETRPPEPPSVQPIPQPPENSRHTVLGRLYRHWQRFIRSLDQPWQWIVVAMIVLVGLFLLHQLL